MAQITLNPLLLPTLKDKIVVLTGGSTGIGHEAVKQFHEAGSKILFGDISPPSPSSLPTSQDIQYQHCDVSSYTSQLSLFKTAVSLWGHIDIVVANAGISIPQDPFDKDADVEKEFSTKEVDVNLKGALYTARIGMHFLRRNGGGDLVLVSSVAGFTESTGLGVYTASKHGVLGMLRGVRVQAEREGIRINAVCPWMTKTAMVAGIEAGWRALSLPENQPSDVARSILICASANRGIAQGLTHDGVKPGAFWGKILFVAGGQSYEIEEKFNELEPEIMGEENSRQFRKGQDFLMNGETSWDTTRK